MQIVKHPNKVLIERCVDVDIKDKKIDKFILEFLEFYVGLAREGRAVGLAANQVGENYRIFVANGELYVNPTIKERSKGTYEVFEGCLSLEDGKQYKVRRNKSITLEWESPMGLMSQAFTGFHAQVIQHEYDHIEGKLLID